MQEKDKERVMGTQLKVLSSLPEEKRMAIMKAMDKAMGMK
jgi:phage-related protein